MFYFSFSTNQESIIYILNISASDNGSYTCELEETQDFVTFEVKLEVHAAILSKEKRKPLVITPPSIVYAREGYDTIVECLFPTKTGKAVWYRVEKEEDGVVTRSRPPNVDKLIEFL